MHGGEAAVAHHLHHARHLRDGVDVGGLEPRAVARTAHDAGMQHAGQAHVLHIGLAARDLGGDVDARQVRGRSARAPPLAARHVGLGLDLQRQRRGEFAVAEAVGRSGACAAPSRISTCSAAIAKRHAAASVSSARTLAAALRMAVPLSCIEWLPAVTPSSGVRAVSAVTSSMLAGRHRKLVGRDLDQRRLRCPGRARPCR